jgi:hypothetical protein
MTTAVNKNESGQALVELIVFLPLMFGLYAMISGFAGAINGSINQQKITRAYLYYRLQNNSYFPKPSSAADTNWTRFSMYFIGWRQRFGDGKTPVAPCYKISLPMTKVNDNCDAEYSAETTQFIRVGTVVGVCGASYLLDSGGYYHVPDGGGGDFRGLIDSSACTIR